MVINECRVHVHSSSAVKKLPELVVWRFIINSLERRKCKSWTRGGRLGKRERRVSEVFLFYFSGFATMVWAAALLFLGFFYGGGFLNYTYYSNCCGGMRDEGFGHVVGALTWWWVEYD